MNKSIPDYQGGGTITSNIGSIKNTGFELSVTGEIIKKADFGWKSTFNFSTVKNEVLSLGDEEYITSYSDFTGLNHSIPEFIYKPGESLGSIYGLKYLGPWKKSEAAEAAKYGMVPGDARYEDLNKIRTRAGLSTYSGLSAEAFANACVEERKWEFAAEGVRWFDVVRLNLIDKAIASRSASELPISGTKGSDAYFFPVPNTDELLNPNINK